MRGALLLAAWASVLAVAEPALDPVLQALYGPRQPQKKDLRLLQAKFGDDEYADSQAYDDGVADYGRVPPSRLLGRIFQSAGIDDYEDERTTLYCITVKPKQSTTPSTTPEVICFPPSRGTKTTRPTTSTTSRPTTRTTSTPIGKCDNANPPSEAKQTHSAQHSSTHSTPRPSSTSRSTSKASTTSHSTRKTTRSTHTTRSTTHSTPRSTHEHAPKHVPTVGNCGPDVLMAAPTSTTQKPTTSKTTTTHKSAKRKTTTTHTPKTTHKRTTARATTRTTRTTHKTSAKPKLDAKGCPAGPQPEPTKTTSPTTTTPKTRPPVDEFLAAWGSFRHHNSLDPRNGSHWREFHDADRGRTQQRRDLGEGVVVIVPPWVRENPIGFQGQAFFAPQAGMRLSKRDESHPESAAPYRRSWYRSWPSAGGEAPRMPARDKENYAKLASWWQDVLRTYNGHQRKKRAQVRH